MDTGQQRDAENDPADATGWRTQKDKSNDATRERDKSGRLGVSRHR
jgi:hypothetical protein